MCYKKGRHYTCSHCYIDPTLHRCDLASQTVFPNPHCHKRPGISIAGKVQEGDCPRCEANKRPTWQSVVDRQDEIEITQTEQQEEAIASQRQGMRSDVQNSSGRPCNVQRCPNASDNSTAPMERNFGRQKNGAHPVASTPSNSHSATIPEDGQGSDEDEWQAVEHGDAPRAPESPKPKTGWLSRWPRR